VDRQKQALGTPSQMTRHATALLMAAFFFQPINHEYLTTSSRHALFSSV
jgi:hypothetical protein